MTGQYITNNTNSLPSTQHGFIAALMKLVPHNQLGLPEGIYRPDLLPEPPSASKDSPVVPNPSCNDIEIGPSQTVQESEGTAKISEDAPSSSNLPAPVHPQHTSQQLALNEHPEVKTAYVPLNYQEGFPTIEGTPFWVQMNFEPADAYRCFDMYLRQGREGARQLYLLIDEQDLPANVTAKDLQIFSEMYFWAARAKSYDMFSAAHRRKERERRAIATENEHYLVATRLMDIATAYLDENEEELQEMMTPKSLLEFVKVSSQLGRVSVGLNANGQQSNNKQGTDEGPKGESTSLEVIMRDIAKKAGHAIDAEIIDTTSESENKLREVLKDEDAIEHAQELILRMNKTTIE